MQTFIAVALIVVSFAIIISVMLQEPKTEGMGALSGTDTNIFGRSASQSKEMQLNRIIIIAAIALVILAILAAVI